MKIEIDVATLSKQDQKAIVFEILKFNKELYKEIAEIVSSDDDESEVSMEFIDKLISQDFERYDEVFRKLA
jgi:predicted transcriptional regulator